MADDHQQDADENARNQAALAAYDRQRSSLRDRHAASQERQQNSPGIAGQVSPQGRGGGWQQPSHRFGAPPAAPQLDDAAGDIAPPQPPQFARDTAAALTAASQAMQAIAATLGSRSDNNSRGRDGDIVINKDVSQVFDEVPEDILERVKYVKTVVNRLNAKVK